jgi:hypothetical protein
MNASPVIRPGRVDRRSLAIGSDATHEDSGTTDVTRDAAATTQDPTTPRTNADGTRMPSTLTKPGDRRMNTTLRPKKWR